MSKKEGVGGEAGYLPQDAPDQLVVMKMVSVEQAPNTAMGRAFAAQFAKDPSKFLAELNRLDVAYWEGKRGGGKWDGKGECPTCGHVKVVGEDDGTAAATKLVDRLLKGT